MMLRKKFMIGVSLVALSGSGCTPDPRVTNGAHNLAEAEAACRRTYDPGKEVQEFRKAVQDERQKKKVKFVFLKDDKEEEESPAARLVGDSLGSLGVQSYVSRLRAACLEGARQKFRP
jgi:hypothetical protein